MVAAGGDVEYCVKGRRLTRRGKHCGGAALQLADFSRHGITGGILQAGVKISARLQIKKLAHILACGVFKGGALDYRYLSRLTVTGGITALNANGIPVPIIHMKITP